MSALAAPHRRTTASVPTENPLPPGVSLLLARGLTALGAIVGAITWTYVLPILVDEETSPEMRASTAMNIGSTLAVVLLAVGIAMIGRHRTVTAQAAAFEAALAQGVQQAREEMTTEHGQILGYARAASRRLEDLEENQERMLNYLANLADMMTTVVGPLIAHQIEEQAIARFQSQRDVETEHITDEARAELEEHNARVADLAAQMEQLRQRIPERDEMWKADMAEAYRLGRRVRDAGGPESPAAG